MAEKRTRDESQRRKKEKKRNRTTPTWMVVGAYTEHKENCDRPPQRSRWPQPAQPPPQQGFLFRSRQAAGLQEQGELLKELTRELRGYKIRLNTASFQLQELCRQQLRDECSKGGAAGNNNGEGGATQDPSLGDFAKGSFPPCGDIHDSTIGDHTLDDTFFQCGSSVVVSQARELLSQSRQDWAAGYRKGYWKGRQAALHEGCCGKGCTLRTIDEGDVDGLTPDQSTADNGGRVLLGPDGLPW